MKSYKLLAAILVIAVLAVLVSQLNFDTDQAVSWFQAQVEENYFSAALGFFFAYLVVATFNLPGSGALTMAAGLIFGFVHGLVLVSFASTLGATFSMLIARFFLREWVQRRFSGFSRSVNDGIAENGASYLFSLRMIPIIPFFVINPVFGLTRMPVWQFYLVSQLGMLPATAIYVNLGSSVADLDSITLASVFTPEIILAFALLVSFPFISKYGYKRLKEFSKLRAFKKPKQFDANLVVIGAGAAGLVSSYIAAAVKAKVFLIEKHRMGGDCLNTGCVPSKALIRAAKAAHDVRSSDRFGVISSEPEVDFEKVMSRVHEVIGQVEPHDSVERYESLGVECLKGEAKILSPYEVEVDQRVLRTRKIIIAAGARARIPDIEGLGHVPYLSSDTLWGLKVLPKRLLILGGGPIGCELAQAFGRLGSDVVLVERGHRLLPVSDTIVGSFLSDKLRAENISLKLNCEIKRFSEEQGRFFAHSFDRSQPEKSAETIEFDKVLIAVGREANTDQGLLEKLNFELNDNGTLKVDSHLQTSVPGIYACGDIAGPYQFTHAASHQAWYASVNALLGMFKKFKVDYSCMPWVIFTDPEIAQVGATEKDLKEKGIAYDLVQYELSELDRAIAEGATEGFVRVLTKKGSDKILGASVVGSRAGELIQSFTYAKRNKRGLNSLLSTINSYPTFAEATKATAGQWKLANKPEKALKLLAWFFEKLR